MSGRLVDLSILSIRGLYNDMRDGAVCVWYAAYEFSQQQSKAER